MLVIAVVEFLAWSVRRADASGVLLKHWPLVAWTVLALYGLVWSVLRVYRVGSGRQTPSIICLIASLLSLLSGPPVYAWFIGGFEE